MTNDDLKRLVDRRDAWRLIAAVIESSHVEIDRRMRSLEGSTH